MTEILTFNYISIQLLEFLNSERCCRKLCGSFRNLERSYIMQYASFLRLRTRFFVCNGIKTVLIYKVNCLHYVESTTCIQLQHRTKKQLFYLHEDSCFIGTQREMQISADYFIPGNIRPFVQPHRFSLGPLKQSMARRNCQGQQNHHKSSLIMHYKQEIIQSIQNNKVVFISGDTILEKSVAIPMFLMEHSAAHGVHCKIICVENDQLLAVYNSEKLSIFLGEKVGDTVAFQVHLQSRISETSNLIYTTASFLLRVLMGQKIVDSFRHISHVIINEVQLHEALSDILLCELKEAIKFHANLKVIMLSSGTKPNSEFISYFGEGKELFLDYTLQPVNTLYLDDIHETICKERSSYIRSYAYTSPPTVEYNSHNIHSQVDKTLEEYNLLGSDKTLKAFLYLVQSEFISVDYQHSLNGYNALNIAIKFGLTDHIQELLLFKADPFLLNEQQLKFLSTSMESTNYKILDCLSVTPINEDCSHIDYALITDIIRMVTTKYEWEIGNILVLLPSYEEIIRLDFYILKHKLIGNLPQMISVNLLHSGIEKDQLEAIIQPKCLTVVLATAVVLRMGFLHSFSYVIDTARSEYTSYHVDKMCEQISFKWVSKESIENRTKFAGRVKGQQGTYFLLISKLMFQKLTDVSEPELLTMKLDKVCLTVKLLAQHQFVAEYFQNTIVQPSFLHVHHTVERLKKMDIMDLFEDLTWLGCRIIDVPVDCQLGKLLVFAILLQCLDPILTIVSFMCCADPLQLPDNVGGPSSAFAPTIRFKIKQERKRIAEGSFSDHLMFIRLYQEWQNQLRDDSPEVALVDEHHFVLNGILESVCETRTLLVGALRSSQLIHNQGHLSMHYINLKSNCWPIIKAALVGGLYPQICVVDTFTWHIKSPKTGKIMLHPSSVLRGLSLETFKECAKNYRTPWIVYGKECPSITCNSIKCCTLVTPFSIALFAGPTKIHSTNVKRNANTLSEPCFDSLEKDCCFVVDEWIWFIMNYTDAQLVLKTRQHFYSLYFDYLQHCGSMDKWRRTSILLIQNPHFFDTIEKILLLEDVACGFYQPENVGIRPKAVPNKCLTALNSCISWDENIDISPNYQVSSKYPCYNALTNCHLKSLYNCHRFRNESVERQFFMVYLSGTNEKVIRKYDQEWLRDSVASIITPFLRPNILTFVIIYHNNPDVFSAVALAKWNFGDFFLQDCFKNKIPIYELINICLKHKICIPTFNKKHAAFQLDEKIGNIILDLFANRNNWLHNI